MAITDEQITSEVAELIHDLQPTVSETRELIQRIEELWKDGPTDAYQRAWRLTHSLPRAQQEDLREQLGDIGSIFNPLLWLFG